MQLADGSVDLRCSASGAWRAEMRLAPALPGGRGAELGPAAVAPGGRRAELGRETLG